MSSKHTVTSPITKINIPIHIKKMLLHKCIDLDLSLEALIIKFTLKGLDIKDEGVKRT